MSLFDDVWSILDNKSKQTNGVGAIQDAAGWMPGRCQRDAGHGFGPCCPLSRRNVKTGNDDGDCRQLSEQSPKISTARKRHERLATKVLRVVSVINKK